MDLGAEWKRAYLKALRPIQPRQPTMKLSFEDAVAIRASDSSAKELSAEYGVSLAMIYDTRNGHYHRPPGVTAPVRKVGKGRPRKHFPGYCGCGCGELT